MPGAGLGAAPARTRGPMRPVKMTLALCASVLGALMPWRTRVLYSELLGWIAQLVPPDLYRMDDVEGAPDPAGTDGDRG